MTRILRIVPEGASYRTVYEDLNFNCQTCGIAVNKVYYSERNGFAEWVCSNNHISEEKIGV